MDHLDAPPLIDHCTSQQERVVLISTRETGGGGGRGRGKSRRISPSYAVVNFSLEKRQVQVRGQGCDTDQCIPPFPFGQ
jgi:hypothetical protein